MNDRTNSTEEVFARAAKGGILVGVSNTIRLCLSLARTIVIARFLLASELGIMGIALFAMAMLESLTQIGVSAAVIQRKDDATAYLDTAQTLSALRGVALAALLLIGAPYLAGFFDMPAATAPLRVLAAAILLDGLSSCGVSMLKRDLDFRKLFLLEQVELLTDLTITITLAVALRNVWALIIGYVAGKAVRCMLSYVVHPFRPRITIDRRKAWDLLTFGKHVFLSGIMIVLITQGDDAVLGKMLGASALGLYMMAYRLSNLPATAIVHVFSQVAFPAYSRLQDDPAGLRSAYHTALRYTSLAAVPAASGLYILAPEITRTFLGEPWAEMVPSLRILTVFGLLRAIGSTTGPLFMGLGRPDIITKLNLGKLLQIAVLIAPLTASYGIAGTSIAVTVPMLVEQVFSWRIVAAINGWRVRSLVSQLLPACVGTCCMAAVLAATKPVGGLLSPSALTTSLQIAVGAAVYVLSLVLFFRADIVNAWRMISGSTRGTP